MFLHYLVELGGFELNHSWHGINMLSVLECALLAACLCTLLALFGGFVRKSRRLVTGALIGALSFATAAYAANTALSGLTASGALAGANLIYVVQTAGTGGVKATFTQVATFINSLFSGDATVSSGGAVTLATVNSNVGSFGSATASGTFTVNAKGLITAAGSTTVTPAIGSVTGLGTGVATQLGNAVSTVGGSTQTIASGATALGTGAISSAACASAVTATATNTATTDVVTASFNGDPTAVTGYIPSTSGMLTIFAYPTLNTVNFKVCNNSGASITPGAITLNWRVVR